MTPKYFTLVAFSTILSAAFAQRGVASDPKQLIQRVTKATVFVDDTRATGWVIDKARRLIVTNHHCVDTFDQVTVKFPAYSSGKVIHERPYYTGQRGVRGQVIDSDLTLDLALVQVDSLPDFCEELKLAKSGVEAGDRVHSVGNPAASSAMWVYSTGVVRTVHRNFSVWPGLKLTQVANAKKIEIDGGQSPGDSGSAIVNEAGEVVGVHHSGQRNNAARYANAIELSELKTYLKLVERMHRPETAFEYVVRGERLLKTHRLQRALADLNKAIELDPKNAFALNHRGRCFNMLGRYDEALADLRKGLELNPGLAVLHTNLASSLVMKGDLQGCLKHSSAAIEADPKDARAFALRAQANLFRNQPDAAIADATAFFKLNDHAHTHLHPDVFTIRGTAKRQKKQYADAGKDFAAILDLSPEFAAPHYAQANYNLGLILAVDMKRYEPALTFFEKAVLLDPKHDDALNSIGWCLCELKRFNQALPALAKALEINPKHAMANNNAGWALNELGQHRKAIEFLNKAIEFGPNIAWGYWNRSIAYSKLGHQSYANSDYQKAIQLNPALANR